MISHTASIGWAARVEEQDTIVSITCRTVAVPIDQTIERDGGEFLENSSFKPLHRAPTVDQTDCEASDLKCFFKGNAGCCLIHIAANRVKRIIIENGEQILSNQIARMQNHVNRCKYIFDQIQQERLGIT